MDPQQRLLLELSWEAIENTGIKPSSLRGSDCGVYVGIASTDYAFRLADDLAAVDSSVATGITSSIAANRISYIFDLRGPSLAIDTACSSSLIAFHQACRSILSGESGMALAGGISLHLHPYGFINFSKASMLSKRGRCSVFDASGDGYVRSEGGGIFVLKDCDQAVADGNPILAVVAASAVNTDGYKSGLTVPRSETQIALLEQAYAQAGIDPASIDYIEAHGTGTAVGDPIETRSIGEALGKRRPKKRPLPIGSVKSNLGHLEAASGVAGLVKALYCIRHRLVPATIGLETPNPKIDLDDWNLEVVTRNLPLRKKGKLVIGVNSFGFGGANAHVILESREAPSPRTTAATITPPLILSGKSDSALKAAAGDLAGFLERSKDAYYDIAYSEAFHRDWHDHRAVIFGDGIENITQALRAFGDDAAPLETGVAVEIPSGPAFIYSGNGSQWFGMGMRLLDDPLFSEAIREVDSLFRPLAGYSLEDELLGLNGEGRYESTEIAQPALFALQVGITQMLRQRGLMPVAVAGHSVGEVAAAWAAGILTLDDAVQVVFHRSRLQESTRGQGQMTAVGLGDADTKSLLDELGLSPSLELAGVNSPRGVTVAGDPCPLSQLEAALAGKGVLYKRLDLDYAFHSRAMDPIEAEVAAVLATLLPMESSIPFYSTVTGNHLDGRSLQSQYWWHNIRMPVLFEQAIRNIIDSGVNIFIEIGPHAILSGYLNEALKDCKVDGRVIPTLARHDDYPRRLGAACSQAIIAGAGIDWQRLFPVAGNFTPLPNYPWQRERHWHPVTSESMGLLDRRQVHPLLGYPLKQQELTWENQLDTLRFPALGDHIVGEATVFPGTGFVELALAAALEWHPGEVAEIEELEIHAPLLFAGRHSKTIRLSIAPDDGGIRIKSREYAGSAPWTAHAAGRIRIEPHGLLLRQALPLLPERPADFDAAIHDSLTERAGLNYGPAFRCIDSGWVEGNEALAILTTPLCIETELEQIHLHPALLDCTFQLIIQLLKAELVSLRGMVFVPAKIGRIVFQTNRGRPRFASARLTGRAPHSLTADFCLFDEEGRAIAAVQEARFRAVRLEMGHADHLHFLGYHGIPKPCASGHAIPPAIPFENVQRLLAEVVGQDDFVVAGQRYAGEVEPLLDSLCSQFILETLQQIAGDGGHFTRQQAGASHGGTPGIAHFIDYLIDTAEIDQSITIDGQGWRIQANQENRVCARDIWAGLVAEYPDFFPITHAAGRMGLNLRPVLGETRSLTDIVPAKASLARFLKQVLGAERKQRIGRAIRDLISQGLSILPEGDRLGILEVSHGGPLFATDVCISLDFSRCDYNFASDSPEVLEEANRIKEHFPQIHTCLIGQAAGPETSLAHLAIVSLDFSELSQAMQALAFTKSRLAPGGTLLLMGLQRSHWLDFVFGVCPGWFLSENGARLSNQRSIPFWQRQLQQLGLSSVAPLELTPGGHSDIYLLLARNDTPAVSLSAQSQTGASQRNWVLLADEAGYSAELAHLLATRLQALGDFVVIASLRNRANLETLLADTTGTHGKLEAIVFLTGLEPVPDDNATALLEHQRGRCASLSSLIQACERTQIHTICWLVTRAAATGLLPRGDHRLNSTPADSALWGFGRTAMNEASNFAIRMVDFEPSIALDTLAEALEREFEQADAEQEVILTATGKRFVPRLRSEQPTLFGKDSSTGCKSLQHHNLRLGFQFPGQLRNLRWEVCPRGPMGDDELEIEVHATGLNFRDLMYSLGLLSDEAVEKGFAGPTLGLEFAGVVLNTGSNVNGFSTGDKVVGFGPSSFANRVVTKAEAISRIPPGISFEAAATIPSVFLTVYYALHHLARLQEGEKVLIHGAAGGVGIAAIQLARSMGAEIYATAGSEEKRDFLRLMGIGYIFDSRSLAFADEILALTDGKGVDVVLNSIAGEAVTRNLQVLKPFGRFLELGKRDFYENTKIGLRPFRNNISYFGIDADQLMRECPDLTRRLFTEVLALFAEGVLHPLPYHCFEAEDITDAFRYMQQARHIGKILVTYRNGIDRFHWPASTRHETLQLPADATYLVTGGLSGFGLRTAEWLAEKGARHLVLISRSGPASDEARQAIDRLESQGVAVLAKACDVTDHSALAALFEQIPASLPPLKGLVHAAMVIDDGLIQNLDAAQIHRVLAPKVLGAQYLHEMTRNASLDFFILFSSATTLFGNPGQGSYVAANSWLEALARHRRDRGLPATCIGWGAIDDVGFLARNEKIKDALQNRMGGMALNSAVALGAMEKLLLAGHSGFGVLSLDWKSLARFLPTAGTPKFSEIAQDAGDGGQNQNSTDDVQHLLNELSKNELLAAFIEILKKEVSEILRISPEKINPTRSLYDMGLDSLMGVEFVVAVEARFGTRLPVMALSENPTIAKLAERILNQLRGDEEPPRAGGTYPAMARIRQISQQHGVEISEDDVMDLSANIQSGQGALNSRMIRQS